MNISSNSTEEGGEILRARTIVIGDSGVGKTSIIRNFIKGRSNDSNESPISDISEKSWDLADGRTVRMTIMDTGGLERYRSLTSSFYRGVHGCLVVFNVNKMSSFDSVDSWIRDLRQYTVDQARISTILVGTTHPSFQRVVTFEKANQLAQHLGIPYMEVDLIEGNVSDVFRRLAGIIFEIFQRRCSIVSAPLPQDIMVSKYKHTCCNC